jgi:hypothetical protein
MWRWEGAVLVHWLHWWEQGLSIQQTLKEHKRDVYVFRHMVAMMEVDGAVGTIKHGDARIATTIKLTSNGIR